MRRIERDRRAAGVGILIEDPLPGRPSIARAVDAALLVGAVGVAENRGEHAVRIARVDGELGNLLTVGEAAVCPGASAVGGTVDAVADREIRPPQAFTACDVDDIGIGGRDRDCADRLGRLPVEDRLPGAPRVTALPHAAVGRTDVEDVRLRRHARDRPCPPAAHRADHAPGKISVRARRLALGEGRAAGGAETEERQKNRAGNR